MASLVQSDVTRLSITIAGVSTEVMPLLLALEQRFPELVNFHAGRAAHCGNVALGGLLVVQFWRGDCGVSRSALTRARAQARAREAPNPALVPVVVVELSG